MDPNETLRLILELIDEFHQKPGDEDNAEYCRRACYQALNDLAEWIRGYGFMPSAAGVAETFVAKIKREQGDGD